MKRDRIIAATAGAAGLAVIAPVAALSATAPFAGQSESKQESASGEADPAAVDALVEAIDKQLATLAPGASQADVEAAIIFALDQAQQPDNVVLAALARVKAKAKDKKIEAALANVLSMRTRLAGTGGIGGPGGDLSFGPSLAATGGGSSDYTPPS